MAVRPVVVWPDERLRQPSVAITTIDDSVRALYQDLVDSMYAENGLGIAALQLGDPRRMFIVEPKLAGLEETDQPVAFINPEVLESSDEQQDSEEGCLSFPDIYVEVERPIRQQGIYTREVEVGSNVWIGYGACILRGVRVGDNAIIGTNSVVTKDVPANAVVGGVPAKVLRMREAPKELRWPDPVEPEPDEG